jgi:hypothetical protein
VWGLVSCCGYRAGVSTQGAAASDGTEPVTVSIVLKLHQVVCTENSTVANFGAKIHLGHGSIPFNVMDWDSAHRPVGGEYEREIACMDGATSCGRDYREMR